MKRFGMIVAALLIFSFLPIHAHEGIHDMADAAQDFLKSLSPELREKAVMEFKSDERGNWHYFPKDRKGVSLKELSGKQKDLVHALLDSALSRRGFIKATTVMSIEQVLFEMENKNERRDPGLYFVTIFGEPSETGTWGWRFEGHHLSINLTLVNGKFVSGTPMFMGGYPAETKKNEKLIRVLPEEEDLGRKLVNALDDDQKKSAIFSETAPREILTGADRKVKPLEQKGIAFAEMNREQGELLLNLIKEYIYRFRNEIADEDWAKIKKAGLENIHFAWAGSTEKGQGHYYRVQGPTFLLEYDNVQNKANHVHTVWRDFENDFGEDLLKKHYEQTPHSK